MAAIDRTNRVQSPPSRREELLRMKRQLEDLLSGVEAQIREAGSPELAEPKESIGTAQEGKWTGSKRPVRELVLDSLDELGWPAYTREITQYCTARFGREIAATRYGSLMKDEMQAFRPGTSRRPVWLCFALTSDRHQAIKRLLCRSDWPLDRRILAPSSGLVQYLSLTARLCELAMKFESSAADAQMLRIIAADHARDLPGVRLIKGKFDLEGWRSMALEQLRDAAERDEVTRKASAERLEARSELYQLFGMPDLHEGPATEANEQRVGS